jgi:putative flavoprotein involved in K+ transport
VTLTGHFLGATHRKALFAPDLDQTIAWGDERYLRFRGLVDNLVAIRGLEPPALDDPQPLTASAPNSIDLADIGLVIFAAGFRPDYRSWLPWPDAFQNLASSARPLLFTLDRGSHSREKSATP